jgi:hypothetical protein
MLRAFSLNCDVACSQIADAESLRLWIDLITRQHGLILELKAGLLKLLCGVVNFGKRWSA